MNHAMKAALEAALHDILAMSPEEFLAAADQNMTGEVFDFFMSTGKFHEFDLKSLEPLHVQFAEAMPEKIVLMLSQMRGHNPIVCKDLFDAESFAMAA